MGFMDRLKRGWQVTKLSFKVLNEDKRLLLIPFLAGFFSLVFMAIMIFPTIISSLLGDAGVVFSVINYVVIFITYLGVAFIATFFNVSLVYILKEGFEGRRAGFGESLGFSFSRIHQIFMWSLVAATVGLILKILDNFSEKLGTAGKIVLKILIGILGMIWSVMTIFVVPSMVYNKIGPFASIKKSVQVLKKTWGENLVRFIGLGIIQILFILLGLFIFIGLGIIVSPLGIIPILVIIFIAIIYFLIVILLFSAANTVFSTALYIYAETGKVPGDYTSEMMEHAFKRTK